MGKILVGFWLYEVSWHSFIIINWIQFCLATISRFRESFVSNSSFSITLVISLLYVHSYRLFHCCLSPKQNKYLFHFHQAYLDFSWWNYLNSYDLHFIQLKDLNILCILINFLSIILKNLLLKISFFNINLDGVLILNWRGITISIQKHSSHR